MKRILILLFLLITTPSYAMTSLFSFNTAASLIVDSTYFIINGANSGNATETARVNVVNTAIQLKDLNIEVPTAPENGAGTQNLIFTVMINGVASALACTISESSTTCADTDVIDVAKGSTISLRTTTSGTPVLPIFRGYIKINNLSDEYAQILTGGTIGTSLSATVTNYTSLFIKTPNTAENVTQYVIPMAGKISNFYALLSAVPDNGGGTQSYTITVRKNAVDTILSCVISETNTICQDFMTISVAAGDLISVSSVPLNTPAARALKLSATFRADDLSGRFIDSGHSVNNLNASTTAYVPVLSNQSSSLNTTARHLFPANLYAYGYLVKLIDAAPNNGGGTQSYTFSLRNETAGTNTAVTCPISEANTTCSYLPTVALPVSNFGVHHEVVPSNTPTVSTVSIGTVLSFLPPTSTTIKNATVKNALIKAYQ